MAACWSRACPASALTSGLAPGSLSMCARCFCAGLHVTHRPDSRSRVAWSVHRRPVALLRCTYAVAMLARTMPAALRTSACTRRACRDGWVGSGGFRPCRDSALNTSPAAGRHGPADRVPALAEPRVPRVLRCVRRAGLGELRDSTTVWRAAAPPSLVSPLPSFTQRARRLRSATWCSATRRSSSI